MSRDDPTDQGSKRKHSQICLNNSYDPETQSKRGKARVSSSIRDDVDSESDQETKPSNKSRKKQRQSHDKDMNEDDRSIVSKGNQKDLKGKDSNLATSSSSRSSRQRLDDHSVEIVSNDTIQARSKKTLNPNESISTSSNKRLHQGKSSSSSSSSILTALDEKNSSKKDMKTNNLKSSTSKKGLNGHEDGHEEGDKEEDWLDDDHKFLRSTDTPTKSNPIYSRLRRNSMRQSLTQSPDLFQTQAPDDVVELANQAKSSSKSLATISHPSDRNATKTSMSSMQLSPIAKESSREIGSSGNKHHKSLPLMSQNTVASTLLNLSKSPQQGDDTSMVSTRSRANTPKKSIPTATIMTYSTKTRRSSGVTDSGLFSPNNSSDSNGNGSKSTKKDTFIVPITRPSSSPFNKKNNDRFPGLSLSKRDEMDADLNTEDSEALSPIGRVKSPSW